MYCLEFLNSTLWTVSPTVLGRRKRAGLVYDLYILILFVTSVRIKYGMSFRFIYLNFRF